MRSIAKVTKIAVVARLLEGNTPKWARSERVNMAIEMVKPTGTEYSMMLRAKRFLILSVLCSRAKMRPGKPIQAKFSRDISTGEENGYLIGTKMKITAKILA